MSKRKQKLELTWIGKDNRPRLEPRILLEDPELSYHAKQRVSESDCFDNKLIFGDNLLALKALEQEYAGKVKCVYVDPPFNTGEAFENYDDGVEHSLWLNLMQERFFYLHKLLSNDGTLFVHIDDNEMAYLMVLLDELFGRENRVSIVTFKQGSATGHKAINPGIVTTTNYILIYARNKKYWLPNRLFTSRERDSRYSQVIVNYEAPYTKWRYVTINEFLSKEYGTTGRQLKQHLGKQYEEILSKFVLENAHKVIRTARPDYNSVGKVVRETIDKSKSNPDAVFMLERDSHSDMYFKNGERFLFYKDKLKVIDGEVVSGEPLTNLWDDVLSNNLHKEGGVKFPKGKKPEHLIKRVLDLTTESGDIVLDSFAGSGTTAAVAHKMKRRWITIELGEHCHSHILPRLKKIISGTDQDGITKNANWKGGGGFRYYKLAPSMILEDRWGQPIINPEYNAAMLSEAMCKHMGFTYAPSETRFWNHGYSTESDFIYITTQSLSYEQLKIIHDELGPERTLVICCKAHRYAPKTLPNITINKIPQSVLKRCEWGRDDYSLNVERLQAESLDIDNANEEKE